MKIKNTLTVFLFFLVTVIGFAKPRDLMMQVNTLRCQNERNPLSVEEVRLSWKLQSLEQGACQTAWEIQIATSPSLLTKGKADVWHSGKVISDNQFDIFPKSVKWEEGAFYWWRVRVWDGHHKATPWSSSAYFSVGLLTEKAWQGKWITFKKSENQSMPYFRKTINWRKGIQKGVVPTKVLAYFCGLGYGDLYMNGQLVDSTRVLDPAQTNYEKYAFYSTFDVTSLLSKKGADCIGVVLGNGWFNQDAAWGGIKIFKYGDPMFRFQLCVDYSDGSRKIFGSDETWLWKAGPILKNNIYMGEVYDARKEIPGWSLTNTVCDDWHQVVLATQNVPPLLYSQHIPPIRMQKPLGAVQFWQDTKGRWIYDFGVNNAANILIEVTLPVGTHLQVRTGEGVYRSTDITQGDSVDFRSSGQKHHGPQTDEYFCKGEGLERWVPRFTYHGFRYAELTIDHCDIKPQLNWLRAVPVHTNLVQTGSFECSNTQINKLHELALRTVINNMHGVPTDCPQREKCGWLGDTHAYVRMANDNYDLINFYSKYLDDICSTAHEAQENALFHQYSNKVFYRSFKPAGLPYMVAPGKRLCGVASPDWGTALVQLPWNLYLYYGDEVILTKHYKQMKQWVDYISSIAVDGIVFQGLGDWCPPGGNKNIDTNRAFTSTAFHYLDVSIMEHVAALLGKQEDQKHYAEKKEIIAKALYSRFYNPYINTFGSQTADAMALDLGFVPKGKEREVSNAIVANIKRHNDFFHVGIFGIGRIGSALSRHGNAEVAWNMFTKKGDYSFANMWEKEKATTLWEVLPICENDIAEIRLRSFSHPMQSGYDAWFYEDIAGLLPDPSSPGFKTIIFEPLLMNQLAWAKASLDTRYGKVVSDWNKKRDTWKWIIHIPANTSGLVALPDEAKVLCNGTDLLKTHFRKEKQLVGSHYYRFPSGSYNLTICPSKAKSTIKKTFSK